MTIDPIILNIRIAIIRLRSNTVVAGTYIAAVTLRTTTETKGTEYAVQSFSQTDLDRNMLASNLLPITLLLILKIHFTQAVFLPSKLLS